MGTQKDTVNTITEKNEGQAKIEFEKKIHDFGRISEGEIVSYTFLYENTGTSNLIITDVKTSCGCTTPGWDNEPVMPGGKGKIEISFDSSGRTGNQYKEITVFTNSPIKDSETLTITAEII